MAINQKIMGPKRLIATRGKAWLSIGPMRQKAIKTKREVADALPQGPLVAEFCLA
ncbi:hypothetical protein [Devosia aurantiaca]|uniref:Uncharacterized protein n=1 Tax=Devosia aurantiaca TaxID=2714858 RepID=A0A6M1SNK2_9HYPH|nr:hypothetical protein [Devosia aurantiaca]NGP18710.1 hypothetical protein [Devosia aurantiaca]